MSKKPFSILGKVNEEVVEKSVELCKKKKVIIPTFAQMKDPSKIPQKVKEHLKKIGLWEAHPLNMFRISWKNEPKEKGGLYNPNGNFIEFPSALTGTKARIIGIVGKWFPTGAHKVGAGFGCLVPRLVTGAFDPTRQRAVWPSTGNYCRGGAFDCALLGCDAIAILPEQMSKERFEWLRSIGTKEIFATPGCESNVKEIYDKCWELRKERGNDIVIFNQFEEFGNCLWHYHVTGGIIEEIYEKVKKENSVFGGYCSATGSAGTIAAGDYLRKKYPNMKCVAVEALECPTLLNCGFGGHRIEGIGDKHVPWIHNVRNTDGVVGIEDEQCVQLVQLFNEKAGQEYLKKMGVEDKMIESLSKVGISGICNLISAVKTSKYYEMDERYVLFVPLTDSMDLYGSRLKEYAEERGREYTEVDAAACYARYILGTNKDNFQELGYWDRKRLHNFKYFTWVEQQGKTAEELNALWDFEFWDNIWKEADKVDKLIEEFNKKTGCLDMY